MFGTLFGKNRPRRPTETLIVWMTAEARWRRVMSELTEIRPGVRTIAVAHFDDSLASLEGDLEAAGVRTARLKAEMIRTGSIPGAVEVVPLLHSADLKSAAGPSSPVDGRFTFVLTDVWPSGERDAAVREFAAAIAGSRASLRQHISLDDAILSRFMGETTSDLLEKLGMDENEPIEHQMVANAVRRAQQKIASTATGDGPAASAEDWFTRYTGGT